MARVLQRSNRSNFAKLTDSISLTDYLADLVGWNEDKVGTTNIKTVNPVTIDIPSDELD